jgi:hypothetical protein
MVECHERISGALQKTAKCSFMRALVVCQRNGTAPLTDIDIESLARRLTPDDITPRPPLLRRERGVVSVLFDPSSVVDTSGASFCLGHRRSDASSWATPGSAPPDGSYALVRVDDRSIELLADAVASRTLWYVMTDSLFVASTSQRAIASVIRSFEPNRQASAWMLSSGTLGPSGGWDRRVRSVAAGGQVLLDRLAWRLSVEEPQIEILPETGGDSRHAKRLEMSLERVFEELSFDPSKWVLPLSGGVDSRGLLLMLKDRSGIECVTWGVKGALEDERNDAQVAGLVARRAGVAHRFLPIAVSSIPRERLVERLLVAGEGRTDRVSGYLDGFAIWRTFYESGIDGVIRGDEAFGWTPVRTEAEVRRSTCLTLLTDICDARTRGALDLPPQTVPSNLLRRPGESLATWRDRAYQQFRLPKLLAALTDLKCAYVEVANPLLFNSVIECVRTLPDRLRSDKRLWRTIVRSLEPDIPFAKRTAVYPLVSFISEPATLALMLEEMSSETARDMLGPEAAVALRSSVEGFLSNAERDGGHGSGSGRRPRRLRDTAAAVLGRIAGYERPLDPRIFAFRAFLISRMCSLLRQDAEALGSARLRVAHQ